MLSRASIHKAEGARSTRQEIKAQLAHYVAQQPRSKQTFDKWMKVLEIAGLMLMAGAFAVAMYVSINHTAVPGTTIAAAWLAFPVSVAPLMILIGGHAMGLRAFYPIVLPSKPEQFVTGSKAVRSGLGLVVIALLIAAFWGTFAWAVWSNDMALIGTYAGILARILSTTLAVVIPLAVFGALFQKLFKFFR